MSVGKELEEMKGEKSNVGEINVKPRTLLSEDRVALPSFYLLTLIFFFAWTSLFFLLCSFYSFFFPPTPFVEEVSTYLKGSSPPNQGFLVEFLFIHQIAHPVVYRHEGFFFLFTFWKFLRMWRDFWGKIFFFQFFFVFLVEMNPSPNNFGITRWGGISP